MATIKDVSKRTGLSISTISKYLNGGSLREENRIAIEAAIKELNYKVNHFARGLKTSQSLTVGLLLPTISNPFFSKLAASIDRTLREQGYHCILCSYDQDEEQEVEKLRFLSGYNVDGMIIIPENIRAEQITEIVGDLPLVLVDRCVPGSNYDTVLMDNQNASYTATEHLFFRGHRRIGIIGGPRHVFTGGERITGYIRAHEDYQIPQDEALIQYGNYDVQSGYNCFHALMDLPEPPTAVYVTNYDMTLGAINAARARGIQIPGQLDFIGFDVVEFTGSVNDSISKPTLSVVGQPTEEMGVTAAQVLLRRLQGENGPARLIRLKSKLITV